LAPRIHRIFVPCDIVKGGSVRKILKRILAQKKKAERLTQWKGLFTSEKGGDHKQLRGGKESLEMKNLRLLRK